MHRSKKISKEDTRNKAAYFPVPIDSISCDELEMDLYIIHSRQKPVLFRAQGVAYSAEDCKNLFKKGTTHFYVPIVQHQAFQSMMKTQLVSAYNNPGLKRIERNRIVRDSCGQMIEDFLNDPDRSDACNTLGEIATQFTQWCIEDESKFGHLLDMSEHDYYTTTHMVNVGVACGLLGAELLGADDPMVRDIMLGGLVHDVGKCGVSSELLNKEGKLNDDEWKLIRAHPEIGVKILRNQEGQNSITIDMTLSHHERLDGHGYPNGLSHDEISLPAKICTVADVYDAMSSARPYRAMIPPRTVLESMRKEVGTVFDCEVFEAWVRVVERMLKEDPDRAFADDPKAIVPDLSDLLPGSKAEAECECRSQIDDTTIIIKRRSGEPVEANLMTINDDEALVCSTVRFKAGERVVLCISNEFVQVAVFESTRVSSEGEMLSAFKIPAMGRAA
jgi:HD-GYP domain-containing protein (c-di-GMP phosphodiesterase class II)